MKELSIEEKAKRYDEAIERAREWYNKTEPDSYTCIVESIFPELKESEGERIRKTLMSYLRRQKECASQKTFLGIPIEQIIAWLEKQGEQNVPSREMVLNVWELGNIWKEITNGVCNTEHGTQLDYIVKHWKEGEHYIKSFEKQGKQKETLCDKCKKEHPSHSCQDITELGRCAVEHEQKLADEIESFYKYEGLTDFEGTLADICIGWIGEELGWKQYIKDNADVLLKIAIKKFNSVQDVPFEQKPTNKIEPKFKAGNWIVWQDKSYKVNYNGCGYELIDQNGLSTSLEYGTIDEGAHLWTIQDAKEGDVLSYKDSKNNVWVCIFKEYANERVYDYCTLNKESFWEYGNWNYLASFSYTPATKEQRDILFQKIKEAGYEWDNEKKELKKIEHNPTWSEEDERIRHSLIVDLSNAQTDDEKVQNEINEEINWLKSLKDRVQPQPKQEWSEEDETRLTNTIIMLKEGASLHFNKKDITKAVNWLKSLRPQNRWKPSDEQMTQLKRYCPDNRPLTSLYEQLKKIREE